LYWQVDLGNFDTSMASLAHCSVDAEAKDRDVDIAGMKVIFKLIMVQKTHKMTQLKQNDGS